MTFRDGGIVGLPRILILTQMFPSSLQPTLGTFVAQRAAALASQAEVRIAVPTPWFPPLPGLGRYSRIARLEHQSVSPHGQPVLRPRYFMFPKTATWLQGLTMSLGVRHCFRHEAWKPQVIDAHFAFPDGFAAVQVARHIGCKCIITCHGSDLANYPPLPLTGWMLRSALAAAHHVIAVSPELHSRALALGSWPNRTTMLPNGVNTELFRPRDPIDCRRLLGLVPNVPLAVCVGRLDENKNQIVLLRALAECRHPEDLPVHLALVGDGPLGKYLRRRAKELGVARQVIFAGSQPYDRVPLWMAAADWLVLSSRREGWPTVYHEAMACGRPVITSNVAAARHAVCDDPLGTVVCDNTPRAFACALAEASRKSFDPQVIRRHAMAFDWGNWAQTYMGILRRMLYIQREAA